MQGKERENPFWKKIGGNLEMEGEGEELFSSTSPTGSDKVKLFCSHGGKILPCPSNGILKYVGGETRVIGVSRPITFSGMFDFSLSLYLKFSSFIMAFISYLVISIKFSYFSS